MADQFEPGGQRYFRKCCASRKSPVIDPRDTFRDRDGGQAAAVPERIFADPGQTIRKYHLPQTDAVGKRIFPDFLYTGWNADLFQVLTSSESRTFQYFQRAGESNVGKLPASSECHSADDGHAVRDLNAFEIFAHHKCVGPECGHFVGDPDLSKVCTPAEGVFADGSDLLRDHDLFKLSAACESTEFYCCHLIRDFYGSQAFASEKYITSDHIHTFRNIDRGEVFTTSECFKPDFEKT